MAALALLGIGTLAAADDEPAAVANTVRLQLKITGLPASNCLLKIAPAHAGCRFPVVERQIAAGRGGAGMVTLEPILIQATSTGADRDCSFAITLQEPGRPPQTFRRGLRLVPPEPGKPGPVRDFRVYLSAPSLAARDEAGRARR
jgi:hypothetical protein